jgi:peptide/nickel transport system substrate-binding protein
VILIDHLKEVYIDGELEPIDTAQWLPKVIRKDYTIALNLTGNGLDDPDQTLYENFTCGAEGNYDGYCNPEFDKMVDRQSMEFDQPSAGSWSGRSNASWPKTPPARSSGTTV